jgi:hypothetical protein
MCAKFQNSSCNIQNLKKIVKPLSVSHLTPVNNPELNNLIMAEICAFPLIRYFLEP